MSRGEARARLIRAAIALGAARGVGALSLQAIATEAGVSKGLLLYHFPGKAALFDAMIGTLGADGAERLRAAAASADPMEAWRTLVGTEAAGGEAMLLAGLARDAETSATTVREAHTAREAAATLLTTAILGALGLEPRVPPALLGRLLLRQLDGLAAGVAREGLGTEVMAAELDAFALALLALGR